MTTVSDGLHQFIERLVKGGMGISTEDRIISLTSDDPIALDEFAKVRRYLTADVEPEILGLLGEGDFEWRELFDILSDIKMERLKAQMQSIRRGSEHELGDSRAFIENLRRALDRCDWALAPEREVSERRYRRARRNVKALPDDQIPF